MERFAWLDAYLLEKVGAVKDFKVEWEWMRYQVGGKLFAATCEPSEKHAVYGGHRLLSLKCDPQLSTLLQAEYPDILPGFYCDKRNWISIFLDGQVPDDVVRDLCDRSYALVFGKLTKKLQRELTNGCPADTNA